MDDTASTWAAPKMSDLDQRLIIATLEASIGVVPELRMESQEQWSDYAEATVPEVAVEVSGGEVRVSWTANNFRKTAVAEIPLPREVKTVSSLDQPRQPGDPAPSTFPRRHGLLRRR